MTILFNKKTLLLLAMSLLQVISFAQTTTPVPPVEMADALYQSGKIYVVVTALSIIFIGIIVYLIMLDKKIGKLEKEFKNT